MPKLFAKWLYSATPFHIKNILEAYFYNQGLYLNLVLNTLYLTYEYNIFKINCVIFLITGDYLTYSI